jgi:8-oxo-dGTP pyrophosphatase MutT (NUDIX family)
MAYFNKVGLLLLSEDQKMFMVCEKDNFTTDYILPGGRIEDGESDIVCLAREIREELAVRLDKESLEFVGEYVDVAAGDATKDVSIRLYVGKIVGVPIPSHEIVKFSWLGREGLVTDRVSPIIRNKILPDLIKRDIIK